MTALNFIIDNSGDSILENYEYAKGVLKITLKIGNSNDVFLINIPTNYFIVDNEYANHENEFYRTCFVKIQELQTELKVENNIYVPSTDFAKFMKEVKSNYKLAYGMKSTDNEFILSLIGYSRLVSCLVSDMNNIEIEKLK